MNPETPQVPSTEPVNPVAPSPEVAPQAVAPVAPAAVTPTPAPVAAPQLDFSAGWPGAFGIYKASAQVVRVNAGTLLLLFVINLASSLLRIIPVLGPLASLIISLVVSIAIIRVAFAGIDGQKMTVGQAVSVSVKQVLRYLGLALLSGLAIAGAFILLIVPGLIVLPRLTLAPYLMIKKDLGVKESMRMSWELSRGHSMKVWGLIGVTLLMVVACIVLIGIYFLFMYSAALAIFATYILQQPVAPAATPVAPVAPQAPAAPVA